MLVQGPDASVRRFIREYIATEKEGDDRYLDFDRVIPMPPELRETQSPSLHYEIWHGTDEQIAAFFSYPWVKEAGVTDRKGLQDLMLKRDPEAKVKADRTKRNIERHGFPSWYEWSIVNWGTKWNSYGLTVVRDEPGELEITFDTAWSPPEPILFELSRLLPDLEFDVKSFDEGWGFACEGRFKAGESTYKCKDATERLRRLVYEGAGAKDWEPGKEKPKKKRRGR